LPYYRDGVSREEIRRWIPSLSEEEISVLEEYIRNHYDEVLRAEARIKAYHDRLRDAQPAWTRTTDNLSLAERRTLLRERLARKAKEDVGHDSAR
jgi:hypothetical protein